MADIKLLAFGVLTKQCHLEPPINVRPAIPVPAFTMPHPTSALNTTTHPHPALASIGGNCTSSSIHPSLHFFPWEHPPFPPQTNHAFPSMAREVITSTQTQPNTSFNSKQASHNFSPSTAAISIESSPCNSPHVISNLNLNLFLLQMLPSFATYHTQPPHCISVMGGS